MAPLGRSVLARFGWNGLWSGARGGEGGYPCGCGAVDPGHAGASPKPLAAGPSAPESHCTL